MDYNLYVGKMAEKGLISELYVYDIEQSPCASEYRDFFNFCIENIKIETNQFRLNDVFIYFRKNDEADIDSFKAVSTPNGVLTIYEGVRASLKKFFDSNKDIFDDPEFAELKEIESTLGAPFQFLMLQCPMMFIFYHELAHQYHFKNNSKLSNFKEDHFYKDCLYDELSHYYEIDADTFAIRRISGFIIEYNKKINPSANENVYLSIIGVFIASVVLTFFNFLHGNKELYFKDSTHPHSMIRTLFCVDIMIEICCEGGKIDKELAIDKASEIVEKITQHSDMNFKENLHKLQNENRSQFNDYIVRFTQQMKLNENLFISFIRV